MPHRQQRAVALPEAIERGDLSLDDVDARVVETVATLLRFAGLEAAAPQPEVVACPEHRALAREAAHASMVLLRNEGPLLPVDPAQVKRIAVLGRLAGRPNLGDGGSSNVLQPEVATPLVGVRAAFPGADVRFAEDDASIADDADLVLVVVGYTAHDEGEFIDPEAFAKLTSLFPPRDHPSTGFPPDWKPPAQTDERREARQAFAVGGDRRSLRLRDEDEALIRSATARSPHVVVAVMAGSAVVMPWLDEVPAALMLWYPGMEGGHALADVLIGVAEPGGRLPFAMPRDATELVPFEIDATHTTYGLLHGQWWLDRNGTPAHRPFGFGLGYTDFALDEASLEGGAVSVTVRNRGARRGSTVVQVYGGVPDSDFERPAKRLLGFERVTLDPGEARRIVVGADPAPLDVRVEGRWVRETAPVLYWVGLDADSARTL
jgi:beta-glucosidase